MNKRILASIIVVVVLTCVGLYLLFSAQVQYYVEGEGDEFTLGVGETISVSMHEGGGSGYVQCWINENKCKTVKIIDRQNAFSIGGMFGSGNTLTLTFQAVKVGQDTVKISACPCGPLMKDCDYFSGDSARLRTDQGVVSTFDPHRNGDYTFVFKVVE